MNIVGGIHHVTAITSDPQKNFDFYAKLLGLRFVKKTVNFDDPSAYHLYYGNETGEPGTVLTFFHWPELPQGMLGGDMISKVCFEIPKDSVDFWKKRLKENRVELREASLFGRQSIVFSDLDRMEIKLTASFEGSAKGWPSSPVPLEHQIQSIEGVELSLALPSKETLNVLAFMGFSKEAEEKDVLSLSHADGSGRLEIDKQKRESGKMGLGSIHHAAFSVQDEKAQLAVRDKLIEKGFLPTPVVDRFYFKSVYFNLPSGILFEIATDGPGFLIDEEKESLGKKLCLHPQYEPYREKIEKSLINFDASL